MIPGQTKKRLPRCCPVVPSLPTCILSIKVTCTSMLFSWCSWRVRSNNSGFRSPERLCILYYIMKLLDWCSVFILSWIWKKTFWRSKQNQNIFEHSTVNLFAGCLCIIIYIYTRYVLALIFLVLLGKSELETLSCFLFNNLFQGIPRNFRIIQFKTPWRVPLRNSPPTATHNHLIIVKNLVAKWLYCFAYSYSNNDILADPFSIG